MSVVRSFEIIRDPKVMRERAEGFRREGLRIAVVPTMGYLHDGHLSLLRIARQAADVVILTIFVNPTQFGPSEDLASYPRDEEGDLAKGRAHGADLAFCPEVAAMYPPGFQTYVEVTELQKPLCGVSRPGHFRGVATVVTKLFHITRPHVAVFGQKDYQQLTLIRRMVQDLDMGIEIIGGPLVRDPDGLAMSSRNAYLSPEQRVQALCLYRALTAAKELFAKGERGAIALMRAARAQIDEVPIARINYLDIRDAATLEEIEVIERPAVMALAVFIGQTRLIDNAVLEP